MRLPSLRPRFSLGTRIAITTLIALLAVQALNSAVFFLMPRPHVTVYSARWLIAEVTETTRAVFAVPEAERETAARELATRTGLDIRWHPRGMTPPPLPHDLPFTGRRSLHERLRATLASELSGSGTGVIITSRGPPSFPRLEPGETRFVPPEFMKAMRTGPLEPGEGDFPLFGDFEIVMQGINGDTLTIGPNRPPRFAPFFDPRMASILCAILLVVILSAITSRRVLAPLSRLVDAAQRLGRTRDPVPIDMTNLNEFTVVAEALNDMQDRIKRFIDERTQMLAAISHDLRSSLTGLRLDAERLPDGETKDDLIAAMEEMERMISATLTFAGDDLKGERAERVDLAAMLISLCDTFSDRSRPAEYEGPDHAFLICQPTAMKRVFANLIDNAVKYGSRAEVFLAAKEEGVEVTVADHGPGIPPGKTEIAFQPFRRLEDSRCPETGGVGLGLAIARDIVRAHGGEIALANRPEGGLRVRVWLPAASAS
ncbi:histidine kinase [Rhodomicrobium udaipurense JA643]|uniref:histidine kinase n=1 Tax=Rhodomicrobium udaipurense TaxID=1202716 RepID=A0A8I1KIB5_9HYPH|nr:ATP-binding protein [Rhodomicrobium udaipurense]KAI96421.1 histidine kinase [Rhodomicrobium udaipurense JA643]MBJ7544555.1 HAMP domain-containing protein [Rhodomicrobium udaipurense]